jgi:hypothetical protein
MKSIYFSPPPRLAFKWHLHHIPGAVAGGGRTRQHDPDPKGRVSAKWEPVFVAKARSVCAEIMPKQRVCELTSCLYMPDIAIQS